MIEGPELRSAKPWCGASAHTGRPSYPITALGRGLVYINGRICFGDAKPTCMGDHKSPEA